MTEVVISKGKRFRDSLMGAKVKLTAGIAAGGMSLVGYASAATFDINATVGPLVDGITGLVPSLTGLVMALIPLFIVMAVAKFFPDLFDSILAKLRL
jgi:hypothetical protein